MERSMLLMAVGVAKSLGRADISLVSVEEYPGLLLFLFSCKLAKDSKAVVIGFAAAGNIGDTVGKDLVVEGVQQDCPFPILFPDLQHVHVGNDELNRFRCVSIASYFVEEDMVLFSCG